MAFDAARGQVVLFGGFAGGGVPGELSDTWIWDGMTWAQKFPLNAPTARYGHAMAFDAARGQVVLFGGFIQGVATSETWIWDGNNWIQKFPATSPSPRGFASLAYDAQHSQILLSGGGSDTWVWDGSNWTQKFPSNSPSARDESAMTYDAARGQVVLFGGFSFSDSTALADTWVWDGSTWTQKSPANTPPGRLGHALAYDANDQNSVLFGGSPPCCSGSPMNDTWVWDGSNWTQRSSPSSPPSRLYPSMAYDTNHSQVVLFGGSASSYFSDTWVWYDSPPGMGTINVTTNIAAATFAVVGPVSLSGAGPSFTQVNAPAGTYNITYMAVPGYSAPPPQAQTLLNGGTIVFTGVYSPITNGNWTSLTASTNPGAREAMGMAYDAAHGQVVLFGGFALTQLGDTWTFDGSTWTQKSPAVSPPPRNLHGMAYDAAHGQVVLFGGFSPARSTLNDTWVWDGSNWTQKFPVHTPPPLVPNILVYDSAHSNVVMFGGASTGAGATWVWDGQDWTQKFPVASPAARTELSMTYDATRQIVVLFGGFNNGVLGDTWEWDGANWTQKFPAHTPPQRAGHVLSYDAARGQVVLFGGFYSAPGNGSVVLGDTWVWDGQDWTPEAPLLSPPARRDPSSSYVDKLGGILLFGGMSPLQDGNFFNLSDTWLWTGGAQTTGTINVTTNLAAATFTVNGPATYSAGGTAFTQTQAPAGIYTITFASVVGYSTPSTQTQTLSAGGSISFNGVYQLAGVGTIQVISNVPGAQYTISPGNLIGTGKNTTFSNVSVGSYTISYSPVAGCTGTPAGQTQQLTAGSTLAFTSTYFGCTGTIEVDSNIANATFTLSRANGTPVRGGGPYPITLPSMPIDTYTVTFDPINGYNTPVVPSKELAVGGLTTYAANYTVNGTAALGRIVISTNLSVASYGVTSTSNASFTPFTRSGTFFDTLYTVPAGTYNISFTPVTGYFTPPSQTLTLAPGGTIQFSGVYRRLIVALFTGFSNRPTSGTDGVTYPDVCDATNCPGMAQLAEELRADSTLAPGVLAKTFTFYDESQYMAFPPVTPPPGCGPQTLSNPITLNPECLAPLTDAFHQVAQAWITSVAPTPDDRVLIVGHSYGGNRARLFAQQVADKGYVPYGLTTVDPIDWDVCQLVSGTGFVTIQPTCDFSQAAELRPDGVHYILAYTQTQSAALKGYHLTNDTFAYPFTILNDPSCSPSISNLFTPDIWCSHGNIAQRSEVHQGVIQLAKAILHDSGQTISHIQVSNITSTAATVSWTTQDDTANGQVVFSADPNFGTTQSAPESGSPGKAHSVTLSGLQLNRTYYFKVQITDPGTPAPITSAVESFRTTPTVPAVTATNWSLTVGTSAATLQFLLVNSGAPATGVSISNAKIGLIQTATTLPVSLPSITSIQPALVTLTFPSTIGSTGTTVAPVVALKYAGGTVTVGARVQIQ